MEQKIEAALAKKVNLSYRDAPFAEVIADLGKQLDLTIALDPRGLDEAGVEPKQTVTLEAASLSARSAFEVLLSPLHLTTVPKKTGLTITSEEKSAEQTEVRLYYVADLIRVTGESGDVGYDYDTLVDTITSHLSPDSWTDNGGPSSISGYGTCLVASLPYDMHREVEDLIRALRSVKATAAKLKSGEVGPVVGIRDSDRIKEALAKRDTSNTDIELQLYVKGVAKLLDVPIFLDPEGLDEAGVKPDQWVTAHYRDARLGDGFREALGALHLEPVVKGDYLIVTSYEKASESGRSTRLYPVGDIAQAKPDRNVADVDDLAQLMQTTCRAEGWSDHGGQSMISAWPDPPALVVTTSDEAHDEIEQLLTALRESGVAEFNAELRKQGQEKIVERIYPLYQHRSEPKAQPEADKKPALTKAADDKIPTADEVAKLILELLPDASWKEEGVLLRPFHDRLIVRQRGPMLKKIEKVLRQIDASPAPGAGGMGGFF